MSIPTTTASAIVDELVTQIHAITPTHASYQERTWNHAEDFQIAGSDVRTFDLVALPETADPDGIHGADGIGYTMPIQVVTSYGGLNPTEARRLVGADGADLRRVFELLYSTHDGALPVPDTYEIDADVLGADEDGSGGTLVAVFNFLVRFKHSDP
jgi:hypothetical protein